MESITPTDFVTALAAVAATIFTASGVIFNHNLNKKKLHIEKKSRLLDFARSMNNQYPQNKADESLLQNMIYDFCNGRITCMKVFILCLNRPDADIALESFHTSGHLFFFCTQTKCVVRKSGRKAYDIIKAFFIFLYYALMTVTIILIIQYFLNSVKSNTATVNYLYLITISFLSVIFAHSFYTLGIGGKRFRAIRKLSNILVIKDSDLPR